MKQNKIKALVCLLSYLIITPLQLAGADTSLSVNAGDLKDPISQQMLGYAEIIRAEGEYIRMVAEARLSSARAALVDAQTAKEWQEARRLTLLVDQLYRDLRRMNGEVSRMQTKIDYIVKSIRSLRMITTGKTTFSVFQSMGYLLMHGIPLEASLHAMTEKVEPFDAIEFVPNKEGVIAVAFPGGNAGQLFNFVKVHNYSFSPWGVAHVAMLRAIQELADSSQKYVDDSHDKIKQMEKGTLDIWNAPGVSPAKADPVEPTPKPGPEFNLSSLGHPHGFCLAAKGGFKSCTREGGTAKKCVNADNGYQDCRKEGNSQALCLSAKGSYKKCRSQGGSPAVCLNADDGWDDCRKEGNSAAICKNVPPGFKECRNDGHAVKDCLTADDGYRDCVDDTFSWKKCLIARSTYKICREDGLSPSHCVQAGHGYQVCRQKGYAPSHCLAADDGYADCI